MRPWLEGVLAADWSPDGSSLAVLRVVDGQGRLEYPVGKVLADKMYPPLTIRVSPDGTKVAYAAYDNGSSVGIGTFDTTGKKEWLGVMSGQTSTVEAMLSWSPDGKEIWFRSFDPKEGGTIYAVDLKGHKRLVYRVPGHANIFDIARDGRVLLRTDSSQIGILAKGPGDSAERDLSVLDASKLVGISEDGASIATNLEGESAGPKGSVYVRKLDGSAPVRIGDGVGFVLSPDGKWVSGYSSPDGVNREFRLLPTGVGEERVVKVPGLSVAIVLGWLGPEQQYLLLGTVPGKPLQCFAWDGLRQSLRPVCPENIPDFTMYLSRTGSGFSVKSPVGKVGPLTLPMAAERQGP